VFAQNATKEKENINVEEAYDNPYGINKLFVQIQPLYGELFTTNVNAGFGVEAHYYYKDKANFQMNYRKTYGQRFFDFNRDVARKNSDMSNKVKAFNYFEMGGTYHIKDFEQNSVTRMLLYRKEYSRNKWASKMPEFTEVSSKLRQIYGARLGGIFWTSSTDLNRALRAQGLDNSDLIDENGNGMPLAYQGESGLMEDVSVFSNIYSSGLYLGGSLTRIRNTAVYIDNYEGAVDDLIFTVFMDILFAPALRIDDVVYNEVSYSTNAIALNSLGFRAGIEGRYNRKLSWAYGGEIGYRPSIQGRSFYTMFKISIPVFSTKLEKDVESYGK
jgi:hypothetical protein